MRACLAGVCMTGVCWGGVEIPVVAGEVSGDVIENGVICLRGVVCDS